MPFASPKKTYKAVLLPMTTSLWLSPFKSPVSTWKPKPSPHSGSALVKTWGESVKPLALPKYK
jgi:hypothetical protein